MHELSIALDLIDTAEQEAERLGAARIIAIRLRVGALSGVVPSALRGAYELAREGTVLKKAKLIVDEVPIEIYCTRCGDRRGVVSLQALRCNECGTPADDVLRGRELELCGFDIEELQPS